ncbi:unnamed protein product [Cladocopium goreaui]|uniref:Uncharacterized protein n=1 Tax=Cladocopium goreaui TaxID=2562237 RepID=A0A9P1GL59_9DINO|nr:unnamed protein product [Cladocopium goreaui]
MWHCNCFQGLWHKAHPTPLRLPVAEPAADVVPLGLAHEAPLRLPSAESGPADAVPETAPRSRRKSRTYSKMSSFVPEEPDELDDIADMWRYYAFVAEKQVQTRTRRMVEEATVADDQKVQVPTRRSRIQGTQLLQNAMLQYVSYTVFDTIEKGTIHGTRRLSKGTTVLS